MPAHLRAEPRHDPGLRAAGGDAIYIDDATATNDMISVADYERYSLPYMQAMVDEIHRLNHKAIVIYFGGISDRLEQIAATGADCLLMEASMKGFRNEIEAGGGKDRVSDDAVREYRPAGNAGAGGRGGARG